MTNAHSIDTSVSKQTKKRSNKRKTTAEFMADAIAVHGNRYNYSKVLYVRAKDAVIITCVKHGDFRQTPNKHLSGNGCTKCWRDNVNLANTKLASNYFAEVLLIHGNKYSYVKSRYMGAHTKITITCKDHGDFKQTANSHLIGRGCPKCGLINKAKTRSLTNSQFIDRAIETHGDTYNYSKVDYKNNTTEVVIICREHGEFRQIPANHMAGQNCPECSLELSGFKRSIFRKRCNKKNGGIGFLYVIQCQKGSEIFYKIGITSQGLKKRYASSTSMPYDYLELFIIESESDFIFDLEKRLHKLLKGYQHKPSISFGGETECFSKIKPIERLLKKFSSTEQFQLLT